ncbi:MAG: metallophosphoesterase [Clostridia bacterium]|nr:metallophosphoesterase [Clostridia bacterium]
MGLNFVQQIFFKIFTFIITVMYSINGGIVAPSTAAPIKAENPDEVKLVFATIADPQVSNYMFGRYQSFQEACMDLRNAETEFDAIVGIGDIAENGLAEEYQLVYDEINGISDRYIMATGNHDIRLRLYSQSVSRFSTFTNSLNKNESMTQNAYAEGKLAYTEVVNGYKFIVMGSDKTEFEEAYISPEQLKWLDSELAAANGEPVFVILHQPLKLTHNLPTTWGNGTNKEAGSVGDQSEEIREILTKHAKDGNVFLITGHLHAGFSQYSYQNLDGIHSFNVPALSIENKDGDEGGNGSGLTYIVEVYEDKVLFRARNCEKGEWLTKWDVTVPVK